VILKVELLLRQGLDQEFRYTTEVVVEDAAEAEAAGTEFMELATSFSNGIGKAA
jgi:hypothetical protein